MPIDSAYLALALLFSCIVTASSQPPPLSHRKDIDLAFVSPAGGSALPAGQTFSLAIQLTAPHPVFCFIWVDALHSSTRSVLFHALMQPHTTTSVTASFPGCGGVLVVAGIAGQCDADGGAEGEESCAEDAVVYDELYLNFICGNSSSTCTFGSCRPSPPAPILPPSFHSCDPFAPPSLHDGWHGVQLEDVLQLHASRQLSLVSKSLPEDVSGLRSGAVLHLGHSGGIGNKLVAMATALLIALLSNRAVVSLVPQDVCAALDVDAVRPFLAIACSASEAAALLRIPVESVTEDGAKAEGWPLIFAGFLDAQYSTVLACCELPSRLLPSSSAAGGDAAAAAVWVYSGNQYLVPLLQANAHYRPLLLRLFGKEVDRWLMAAILRPSPAAILLASHFLLSHSFSSASVAFQVRQFPSCSGSKRTDVRGVRQNGCGLTMCEEELKAAAKAAAEGAARMIAEGGAEQVLVYVASDEVDEAMGYMSSSSSSSSSITILNSQHVREWLERNGGDVSLLPMMDIIIMSKAKLLITSPGSTFGYAAAAAADGGGSGREGEGSLNTTGTVMTVRPGGAMVELAGARVFSHSKLALVQAACYNGDDMWSTSEDQVCNACPYPLCACNNEGVMCSSPASAAIAMYMLPNEAVDRIKKLHPDWRYV